MNFWLMLLLSVLLGAGQVASANPANSGSTVAANPADKSPSGAAAASPLTSIPMGKGLPVIVRAGLFFQTVSSFNENDGKFKGRVDLRLRWQDLRLRYPADETPRGYKEFVAEQADKMLTQIWSPGAMLDNLIGQPTYQVSNLRIYPDGWVEFMQRTDGSFEVPVNANNFPFDKQALGVEVVVRQKTTKEAALVVLQQDLDFSKAASSIELDGWKIGPVTVIRTLHNGWYDSHHSGIRAVLTVHRQVSKVIGQIFVPLLASLLIPLIAVWMNSTEDGSFNVSAFEVVNIVVGGLFAVIALNFSINSEYKFISTGDNLVTRLFALNYVTLAMSMLIVVLLFRLNLPMRWFGIRVQHVIFDVIYWAFPTMVAAVAGSLILAAGI